VGSFVASAGLLSYCSSFPVVLNSSKIQSMPTNTTFYFVGMSPSYQVNFYQVTSDISALCIEGHHLIN
jgi:hypothetical protein